MELGEVTASVDGRDDLGRLLGLSIEHLLDPDDLVDRRIATTERTSHHQVAWLDCGPSCSEKRRSARRATGHL